MFNEYTVALCSCPSQKVAEEIARELINAKLAACVNILPKMTSIYKWEEKLEASSEVLMIIKTRAASFSDLEIAIKQMHPYECPEIIGLPIAHGNGQYLNWVARAMI